MYYEKWIEYLAIKSKFDQLRSSDAMHALLDDELSDDQILDIIHRFRKYYFYGELFSDD